jgi:hypothetical protein
MSLDGLRAWIGEVERKLQMRTRVFLVLVAIAVGGAAAGIYLGVDAQTNQVSEGDLQVAREELQAQVETLQVKVEALESQAAEPPSEGTSGGLGAGTAGKESEAKAK